MNATLEPVAFGGSHLIDGALYTSYLYDLQDGMFGWEVICVDAWGNMTTSHETKHCEDLNVALLWVLSRVMDYALSVGVEPDQLQIVQRSVAPDSDPEFIALVLRTYHESRPEVRH